MFASFQNLEFLTQTLFNHRIDSFYNHIIDEKENQVFFQIIKKFWAHFKLDNLIDGMYIYIRTV